MNEYCPQCGAEINDSTELCSVCNFNVRANRAENKVKMLESAIKGWESQHTKAKEELAVMTGRFVLANTEEHGVEKLLTEASQQITKLKAENEKLQKERDTLRSEVMRLGSEHLDRCAELAKKYDACLCPDNNCAWFEFNVQKARLAEREACAKVCDGWLYAHSCAAAIRARGTKEEEAKELEPSHTCPEPQPGPQK